MRRYQDRSIAEQSAKIRVEEEDDPSSRRDETVRDTTQGNEQSTPDRTQNAGAYVTKGHRRDREHIFPKGDDEQRFVRSIGHASFRGREEVKIMMMQTFICRSSMDMATS